MPPELAAAKRLEDLTARMLDRQKHRGPDINCVWSSGGLALGHRRLPILDLSEAGRQPMHSRDGRWTIVFNGEVFNYRELREELGGVFRTATDTEVLLEACAACGLSRALARVHGMFAFAIWDHRKNELTLARDRAGEKPLVYFWDGVTLAFASELKALECFHDQRLDANAVDAYLTLGYIPAPLAGFRNCRKLPAGHLIRFKAHANGGALPERECDGVPHSERWWNPPDAGDSVCAPRPHLLDDVRVRIGEAVRIRLRCDVPVALSLSGGVDSSVIATECVRHSVKPEAFTVRFDGDDTDLPFARAVARRLDLQHTVVRVAAREIAARFDDILYYYDEPFADSSALACFALAQAVGERYKVVLDGDGGDEAFGGYRHYEYIGVKQTLKAAAAAAGLCDGAGEGRTGVYVQSKSLFRAAHRRQLLRPVSRDAAAPDWRREVALPGFDGGALRGALRTDRELALANGLTYKMDIALGAFGMEGRAPLLDHAVLEWGQTLPARELVRGTQKKVLLRAAYANELPTEVLNRRKHGFGAPISRWTTGPLREAIRKSLPCPLFDAAAQQGLQGQRLWSLFMFSAWAKRWGARW